MYQTRLFEQIDYLENGTPRQRRAYGVLTKYQVLAKLKSYDPILVGTIPINIDIEGSDLDIICCFRDKDAFTQQISEYFSHHQDFAIKEQFESEKEVVTANFFIENFEIEVFGQHIPTRQQFGYRHMLVEHQLLETYGESFRQKIVALKQQGYKTEPAFALALGLAGDPYLELLKPEVIEAILISRDKH